MVPFPCDGAASCDKLFRRDVSSLQGWTAVIAIAIGVVFLSMRFTSDPYPSAGMDRSVKMDPNSASVAELMTLPRIGKTTARRIVAYRTQREREKPVFRSADDLLTIRGIGPKTILQLSAYLTFPDTDRPASGQ